MRALCAVLACVLAGAGAAGPVGAGARYSAATSVLLSAAEARGGELGYRLEAALAVQPLLTTGDDVLLHFTLESPQLLLRGKQVGADFVPRASLWDKHPNSEFLALWSAGRITQAYLDPKDPPDVLNYKKALISLFQFQVEEGEHNETDVSGECEVQYEAVSELVVRKFKHRCMWEGAWDTEDETDSDGEAVARTERRRAVRYELLAGELRAVSSDDVLRLRGVDPAAGLKARALTLLTRLGDAPPPRAAPADVPAALAMLPALAPLALPLRAQDHVPEPPEEESLEDVVAANRAALEEESAGTPDAAAATLRLLPALRRAAEPQLAALLQQPDSGDIMEGLARALGLAGAAGAHAAAREAFQLDAAAPPRAAPAREYLAALALAPRVQPAVARAVLRLAAAPAELAPAALLAAAAAAFNVQPRAEADKIQLEVKDYVLKSLAKCKEEECRTTRLLALGQLRRGDVGALLLEQATRGGRAPALAALAALAAGPRAQLQAARRRLAALALGLAAPAALEVRAAALELAVAAAEHPGQLAGLLAALRARGPRELRRLGWRALRAQQHPHLEALLPDLDPRPADWCKRAHDGTSDVLERELGPARLRSTQVAERGVLRRGVVDLQLAGRPLLTVEIWTRGLESLSSAPPPPPAAAREPEDDAPAADDDVAAGLALTVRGTRRPDVILFASQGELLGHVWAGTGSAPTAVLRAVLPREALSLRALAAGVLLRTRAGAAAALAQDAQAVVSLWGRTARAGLSLQGAGAEELSLLVRTGWGRVSARAHSEAAPALSVQAALDFYDAPQLCVHTAQPDYTYSRNVTLESVQGAQAWRVRRSRVTSLAVAGRTLALGARNDQACAALATTHRD